MGPLSNKKSASFFIFVSATACFEKGRAFHQATWTRRQNYPNHHLGLFHGPQRLASVRFEAFVQPARMASARPARVQERPCSVLGIVSERRRKPEHRRPRGRRLRLRALVTSSLRCSLVA